MKEDDMLFLKIFGDIDETLIKQSFEPWNAASTHFWVRYKYKIACAMLCMLFATTCIFHTEVKATLEKAATLISEMLHIKEDISNYAEVKDIPITKNNLTLTLQGVVLDKNQLLILVSRKFENKNEITDIDLSYSVKINGKDAIWKRSYFDDESNKVSGKYIMEYYLDESMKSSNPAQIEAIFTVNRTDDGSKIGTYTFDFSASWEELEKDTIRTSLEQSISISDDTQLILSDFTLNSIESNIVAKCNNLSPGYEYYLKGKDNLGNEVSYSILSYENPNVIFIEDDDKKISMNATSVELQLYRQTLGSLVSSSEDDEFIEEDFFDDGSSTLEKIGDKFTINFK